MGSHFFFGCAHLPYHSIAMMVSHSGRQIGLQLSSSSVAQRWEGAAPQLSLRRLPQFLHPHHFQHPRRLHRQLRRQLSLPHPVDPWIPSTAQSILRTRGPQIRRSGAAESTPSGPVDPFNCAVDPENTWAADKKEWCCRIHHRGCPQPIIPIIPVPQPIAPPADPYNCADGFANWQAGWSVAKKEWCCRVHGKGCPNQGGGCVTSSKPYDCDAGFANW